LNTVVLCSVWTSASFTFYLLEFYAKVLPTSSVITTSISCGVAEIVGSVIFFLFIRRYDIKSVVIYTFGFLTLSSTTLYIYVVIEDPVEIYTTE